MPAARDLADLRRRPLRRSLGGVFVLLMVLLATGFTLSLGMAWIRTDAGHVQTPIPRTGGSGPEPLSFARPAAPVPRDTITASNGERWRVDVLLRLWSLLAVVLVSGSAAIVVASRHRPMRMSCSGTVRERNSMRTRLRKIDQGQGDLAMDRQRRRNRKQGKRLGRLVRP
ncbi:hypothetical protein GCM10022419_047530 [Nonomuraea rosea]|uniref:Uncharacterized protein n=1 Tax=Nonomuraea rosea TaxID=638574 RepID=A0ABP6X4I6_9ACTN